MVCRPLAPSGAMGVRSSVWTSPSPSVARTAMVWCPGVAVHGSFHWRQQSTSSRAASVASRHGPSPMLTSTRRMPRVGAQATPPIWRRPAGMGDDGAGTSMRDWVLIGPRFAHPRGIQYPSNSSQRLSSIADSHLVADTYP